MVTRFGSYVTTASWFSNVTRARVTPFTASSADRTEPMHPSQVIPEIVSVTLAGFDAFFRASVSPDPTFWAVHSDASA